MASSRQIHHKKRYGHHQKHTPHFLKTYWPYMPLAMIITLIFVFSFGLHRGQRGVLSFATNTSSQGLLDETNKERAANNIGSLKLNDELNAAAQAKANDMVKRDYWSHNTPDGQQPWAFVDKSGYRYQKAGENLAYGFTSSSDTVVAWMNSPPHRENLLDSAYQDVGFGFANSDNYAGHGKETVVVAMYGRPQGVLADATVNQSVHLPISGFNTLGTSTTEPSSRTVSLSQLLTGGRLPWVNVLIAVLAGAAIGFIILKNSLLLRRAVKQSERFVLKHPLFDLTFVSFVGLCVVLSQATWVIR